MKKILLSVGVFGLLAVTATAVYSVVHRGSSPVAGSNPDDLASATPSTGSLLAPPPVSQGSIKPATTKKYSGQALKFLGDPQILAKYPAEFVEQKRNQLADIIKLVEADPTDETNWMDIGLVKKNFDNFFGVRDAWEYAKLLNPSNALNCYNLGNLYASYLGDNQKAEQNFLGALKLDPNSDYTYLGLAEFYRDFYKAKSDQIDDVLLAGLKVLPADPNLLLQLGFYYKSVQNKEQALEYFNRFLKLSGITGLQQQQVQNEVDALSR